MKKLHLGTGMAYADSLSADECFTGFIQKQKSVLHHCNINMDTLGQPFGLDVGSNQGQKTFAKRISIWNKSLISV
jgi:hypothetical protein